MVDRLRIAQAQIRIFIRERLQADPDWREVGLLGELDEAMRVIGKAEIAYVARETGACALPKDIAQLLDEMRKTEPRE